MLTSPEAERALLGSIVLNGAPAFHEADVLLSPDDLVTPRLRLLYEAAAGLVADGDEVSLLALHDRATAKGGRAAGDIDSIAGLTDDAYRFGGSAKKQASIIRDRARVRRLHVLCGELRDQATEGVEDVDAWLDSAESRVLASSTNADSGARGLGEIYRDVIGSIQARTRNPGALTGIDTGFEAINEMTGGWQRKELSILAARPSMGKTAFALNTCMAAAQAHVPSLFFSLEMSDDQLAERILVSRASADALAVRKGQVTTGDFVAIGKEAERTHRLPLEIDDTPALTIAQVRARARRWRHGMKDRDCPALVFVDYLQLVHPAEKKNSREQEVAQVSNGLKAMAKELNLSVVALAQLNRSVDSRSDKRPMLSDLRESGSIEQDADMVSFLYRPELYHTPETPPGVIATELGVGEFIIGKQRSGPIGTAILRFEARYGRFVSR